jgi:hypothetical protein
MLSKLMMISDECKKNPSKFNDLVELYLLPFLLSKSQIDLKTYIKDLYENQITAGRNIKHENGFTKVSLFKCTESGIQARLHKWPMGSNDVTIHNHRWDLFSFCVEGQLKFLNYSIVKNQNDIYDLYEVTDANEKNEKQKILVKKVNLNLQSGYTISAGNYHFLHHSVLHKVNVPVDSYTLFVSGPPLKGYSNVIYQGNISKQRFEINQVECEKIINGMLK